MQELIDIITGLYTQWSGAAPSAVDVLPQSGSERRYFRLHGANGSTVIGTFGLNVQENETFIYFSEHFKERDLHVPQVFAVSDDKTAYLQEDFGNTSLLDVLEAKG